MRRYKERHNEETERADPAHNHEPKENPADHIVLHQKDSSSITLLPCFLSNFFSR